MKNWQIKRKSNIGQRLETAWDDKQQKFINEISYGNPSFTCSTEEAKDKLKVIKSNQRIPTPIKWVRLYEVIG